MKKIKLRVEYVTEGNLFSEVIWCNEYHFNPASGYLHALRGGQTAAQFRNVIAAIVLKVKV